MINSVHSQPNEEQQNVRVSVGVIILQNDNLIQLISDLTLLNV